MYKCAVESVPYSGMIAFALGDSEYWYLDKCSGTSLIKLMKAVACLELRDEEGNVVAYTGLSNQEFVRRCRVCLASVELCVRRLSWFQRALMNPQQRHVYLTAMFGHYGFEYSVFFFAAHFASTLGHCSTSEVAEHTQECTD